MAFFTILCTLCFYAIATSSDPKSIACQRWIFWTAFALANLAKGPAPVAYVGCIHYRLYDSDPRLESHWQIDIFVRNNGLSADFVAMAFVYCEETELGFDFMET